MTKRPSKEDNGEFRIVFVNDDEARIGDFKKGSVVQDTQAHEPNANPLIFEVGNEEEGDEDPWAIQELADDGGTPWSEMTTKEKALSVALGFFKVIALLTLLYFFVCSLDLLSLGFRLVGGRTTGEIFRQSDILQNPVVGVMIGILTTVLVQSSSTSTSIIVSMVSAGFLTVEIAIPIVMGANIGTSVTNTIVSLTQAGDRNQFRRAFAGATVHDMFNWLTVITLLIIEVTTHYLYHLTSAVMSGMSQNSTSGGEVEILTVITKPLVNLIVQLDKKVLECWAKPDCTKFDNSSLMKDLCPAKKSIFMYGVNVNFEEVQSVDVRSDSAIFADDACKYLFHGTSMSDAAAGAIVLVGSLVVLCTCLILIVKVLNSVLKGQIATVIRKTLNADIPYVPWITGYIALIVGAVMTFLVQSSSVFTSALTPLVGVGVISIERVYPLTLGSNIGTTTTALIAALATEGDSFNDSLQIALCHLFFNVSGILLFYPIPFMRFPISLAKSLGDITSRYRWFAIIYMVLMFLVLPVVVMGLSFAGSVYVIVFASVVFYTKSLVTSVVMTDTAEYVWICQRMARSSRSSDSGWMWLPKEEWERRMREQISPRPLEKGVKLYQFKIRLADTDPEVWRRVDIPGDFTIDQFGRTVVRSIGWIPDYPFTFFGPNREIIKNLSRSEEFYTDEDKKKRRSKRLQKKDSTKITVSELYSMKKKMSVIHMGNECWIHVIELEEIKDNVGRKWYPKCIAGANACPPDECGGSDGYEYLKAAISDPKHKEHDSMKDFLVYQGYPKFNPKKFKVSDIVIGDSDSECD
ncbi:unnamed protein product [Allacma fusca]|uniref:Plasmid pRiA4b Orf3-like domain-containing protein n=1 Tax=Allacma fusca TaxID=39272 RepID=A0A8J2KNK0_9HEXA|nr:unnamed protein product [Allacma fusca]